jgi:hypothetical protein
VESSELGALLVVQRLCLPCLAHRAGMMPAAARARIERLAALVQVRERRARCDGCRALATTYGVQ